MLVSGFLTTGLRMKRKGEEKKQGSMNPCCSAAGGKTLKENRNKPECSTNQIFSATIQRTKMSNDDDLYFGPLWGGFATPEEQYCMPRREIKVPDEFPLHDMFATPEEQFYIKTPEIKVPDTKLWGGFQTMDEIMEDD